MQYVTGYILNNELDVQMHTDGLERRHEKVYERPIKLYREFDNSFTIVVKNQDQKKQFVNDASCELQISDEDNKLVVTVAGVVQDDGSSTGALRFTGNDSTVQILYADTRFDAGINFEVVKGVSPEFTASQEINTFTAIDDEFSSTSVNANPNQNSNDGLHTAAYYLTNFTGSIKIMATMSAGASYGTDDKKAEFFQVDRQDYTEQSGIKYVNFTGVFERVAFVVQMTDSSTVLAGVDKILYRS